MIFLRKPFLVTIMMILLVFLSLFFMGSRVRRQVNDQPIIERDDPRLVRARLIQERLDGGTHGKVPMKELPGGFYFGDDGHWSLPLNDPSWQPANSATYMKPEDPVAGFYFGKRAWALPWWILKNYHVANIELEGQRVLISFCEKCSSACAYDRVLNGKAYDFRMVGLYNGSHIISDNQTNSLWGPFTGEAIAGQLKGARLNRLRLVQCLWSEWLETHPNSLVLSESEDLRSGHGSEHFPGKKSKPGDPFLLSLIHPLDKRLEANELILGIWVEDNSRAYPIRVLDRVGTVLNDTLAKQEIVIIHKVGTMMATAFSRTLRGEVLIFDTDQNGRIFDKKYGSHWNEDGEAYDGPLKGQTLSFLHSGVEEWYIWAAYHPQTDLFQQQG